MNEHEACNAHHPDGCSFADRSADKAVKKTFAIFGVNVDEPREVKEFQDDLRFGNRMRKIADRSILAFAAVAATALAYAIWEGLLTKIREMLTP